MGGLGQKAQALGFNSQLLTSHEATSRSGSASRWLGGIWSPPTDAPNPLKPHRRWQPAHSAWGEYPAAVRGQRFEIAAGKVTGVWTEHGLVKANKVICCGGA